MVITLDKEPVDAIAATLNEVGRVNHDFLSTIAH